MSVQLTIREYGCPVPVFFAGIITLSGSSLANKRAGTFDVCYDPSIMTNRLLLLVALLVAPALVAEDGGQLLTVDHFVRVKSSVPSIAGQVTQIYVREKTRAATPLRSASLGDRVVLFVHGAGTPAEVAFDVPHQDYSWMAYLAQAGFDVFSMDTTGYGRSTRPAAMNDPCNLSQEQQKTFVPAFLAAPCAPSYSRNVTTIASDWNDIDAVVDYVRALRHVERVSMVAWSLGGPRAGGYAARHPEKVQKLVLLAPAYGRMGQT
jgi:pimeloyl-ACP methyl ester carboxylesterase